MASAAWRRAFDSVERAAAPRLERLVREPAFRAAVVGMRRTTGFARRLAESQSRRFWHALNLPASTDVRQLRRQIGAIDREIRLLQDAGAARATTRTSSPAGDRRRPGAAARGPSGTTRRGGGTKR